MGILAIVGLMVVTLGAAFLLWSLLLRAELAGIAFLALAALIVLGALAALLVEARQLLGALLS